MAVDGVGWAVGLAERSPVEPIDRTVGFGKDKGCPEERVEGAAPFKIAGRDLDSTSLLDDLLA
jgi:hypothetical protein